MVIGLFLSTFSALQWGRDQLVAEMSVQPDTVRALQRLQWGRDQLVAEMRKPEPATAKRRKLQWGRDQLVAEINPLGIDQVFEWISLQWGRDQLVAEMAENKSTPPFSGSFNGAATNWSRKCDGFPVQVVELDASMGPRPIGRGNDAVVVGVDPVISVLQWGRDQLVAEILRL